MRPALRYHGGKWKLAPWIISHMPEHRVYVEPFGGAASVLLRKPRSYAEVYNEMDGEIVNFFRVLRDNGEEFRRAVELTPFSRDEFVESYVQSEDPIEQARRTLIKSFMGFGSNAIIKGSGFRANSNRSGTTPAHDWANWPRAVPELVERLRGVVIEYRDGIECMQQHDGPETLHYVDPPYVASTRTGTKGYRFEMSDTQHIELTERLVSLRGRVILSGYENDVYARLGWRQETLSSFADGARARTEVLWMNFAPDQNRLFA